ncbi:MAG: 4Fe-4S binding protein, partial [Gammaproteobacteria bacterium]|nr:4Fe-4S binding protein [Gammaproteobacteria bacterium]
MTHPGLPLEWTIFIIMSMLLLAGRQLLMTPQNKMMSYSLSFAEIPVISNIVKFLTDSIWPLLFLKIIMVCLFLLVIMAGLIGTPIAERNIATVLTWNIWWAALIISVFFIGSAWCAVCPWDTLASWLVRRKLWRRARPNNSLNLKVPRSLSNVWPAIIMLISLTWLELGFGVTTNPYITSVLALLMVVMATVSLAIYDGKAFCRHFCPVGRTIGFYSQLAPVELRPIDPDICAKCTTLDCYHGT